MYVCVPIMWGSDLLFKELDIQAGEMAYQLRTYIALQKTQIQVSASTSGSSQLLGTQVHGI